MGKFGGLYKKQLELACGGGRGQVEEIDAEMNKTWAKERKVTDQLETFKNIKENTRYGNFVKMKR